MTNMARAWTLADENDGRAWFNVRLGDQTETVGLSKDDDGYTLLDADGAPLCRVDDDLYVVDTPKYAPSQRDRDVLRAIRARVARAGCADHENVI